MNFLKIEPHLCLAGLRRKIFYSNGYGASIIQKRNYFSNEKGEFELAVLKGNEENSTICCDTPIASDILEYLEEEEVNEILQEIKKLPSIHNAPSVTEIMSGFVTDVLTNLVK